jgi:NitT/TauT family transport system substrate-binding protein/putative hydroxymethylpyrimidine transport system substrate-binding protein
MRKVAAPLAAVLAAFALGACGGGGAEPGASDEATLVLDFQPNAVHAGIYAALADGYYDEAGVALTVREPSASTDAPKLLASGRAEFAILDIHDLAIARERGLDLVGVGAIVHRPLAAVIARDRTAVKTPGDLAGGSVGVTGLPSDDAVLDAVLASARVDPATVRRVTIGFDSVAALSAGRLDAATAFWNAEGVTLRRLGVPTREFRVDSYGAPRYPELVLTTTAQTLAERPQLVAAVVAATGRGYDEVVADPAHGLDALVAAVPELDRDEQRAQLDALLEARALGPGLGFDRAALDAWATWEARRGIVDRPPVVERAFSMDPVRG